MESPLEQWWRDVVGFEIGDGVPEIMRGVIAREAFGREYSVSRVMPSLWCALGPEDDYACKCAIHPP